MLSNQVEPFSSLEANASLSPALLLLLFTFVSSAKKKKPVTQARAREINPERVVDVAGGSAQLAGGHGVSGLTMRTLQGCGVSQLFLLLGLRFLLQCRYVEGVITCNDGGYKNKENDSYQTASIFDSLLVLLYFFLFPGK